MKKNYFTSLVSVIFITHSFLIFSAEEESKERESSNPVIIEIAEDQHIELNPDEAIKNNLKFYEQLPGKTPQEKLESYRAFHQGHLVQEDILRNLSLYFQAENMKASLRQNSPENISDILQNTGNAIFSGASHQIGISIGAKAVTILDRGLKGLKYYCSSSATKKKMLALDNAYQQKDNAAILNGLHIELGVLLSLRKEMDYLNYTPEQKEKEFAKIDNRIKEIIQYKLELYGIEPPKQSFPLDTGKLESLLFSDQEDISTAN